VHRAWGIAGDIKIRSAEGRGFVLCSSAGLAAMGGAWLAELPALRVQGYSLATVPACCWPGLVSDSLLFKALVSCCDGCLWLPVWVRFAGTHQQLSSSAAPISLVLCA
jgi:hypothetical protein